MKKINHKFLIIIISSIFFSSCDKAIEAFDNSINYIYFNIPFKTDKYGDPTKERLDSITYSFAMDGLDVTEYVFKVPINTVGLAFDADREVDITVNKELTTATDADWDSKSIEGVKISTSNIIDTAYITVKRSQALKKEWRRLVLNIEENDNFSLGDKSLVSVRLSFSDILQPPAWWGLWINVFGEFSKEKYTKWQEIYYLGADPNVEFAGPNIGKPLYWDNMPYYDNSPNWYPTTYMFIGKLKQYFIDNEVYPDGDTSKPRITLP